MPISDINSYNLLFFNDILGSEEKLVKLELPNRREISFKASLLNFKTENLSSVLDKSQIRLMNRAACSLVYFAHQLDLKNKMCAATSEKTGLYCFNNNSEFPYYILQKNELNKALGSENLAPADLFKRSNAVSTSQLANFLEIRGPINTYTNQNWGFVHAAENAFQDLKTGRVNRALLAGIQIFEPDPLNFLNCDNEYGNTNVKNIFERIIFVGLTSISDARIKNELKNYFITDKDVPL